MPTHLQVAPAAAGKTSAVAQLVCRAQAEDPRAQVWALLPDRHQADAFRRRVAERGGALGAHLGTFGDLYTEILALAGRPIPEAPAPVVHRLVLAAIQQLREAGQLKHYAPIQDRPGFALALQDLFAELKQARLQPDDMMGAAADLGPRMQELMALYRQYQTALIDFQWADPEGLGWLAIEALGAAPDLGRGWRLVVVDGFDSFTPTQLQTLTLLKERVNELALTLTGEARPHRDRAAHRRFARTLALVDQDLKPVRAAAPVAQRRGAALAHLEANLFVEGAAAVRGAPAVRFLEAQTQAREAREALRWLKARLLRDKLQPAQCAVIARDLTPYQPFLREAAREFGLPIRFALGEPLAANPAIAAVLNLMTLAAQDWAPRPLLDALSAPYFDFSRYGLGPRSAAALAEVARWGQVVGGLDQWEAALLRLARRAPPQVEADDDAQPPRPPAGPAAQSLWAALAQLAADLQPPAEATTHAYVTWLEDRLAEATGVQLASRAAAQLETKARDEAALEVWRTTLAALLLSEVILKQTAPRPWAEFAQDLRGAVEAARYQPEAGGQRQAVYAAGVGSARGVPYDAVAVLGLSEGVFPAPLAEDPFLSDAEREYLTAANLPLEPRLRSDQQTLFYEAVTRANRFLLLTRPSLTDSGERWPASPFWEAARALFVDEPAVVGADQAPALSEAASEVEVLIALAGGADLPEPWAALQPAWQQVQQAGAVLRARLADAPAGPYEGDLSAAAADLAARFGAGHTWSASRLEAYGACGFQFLIGPALGLTPREAPALGFDAAQLGAMLHTILERVYQAADPTDGDAVAAALPAVAAQVFAEAPEAYGFRPSPLWETEQAAWLERLTETVRALHVAGAGFRPVRFEARFDGWALTTSAGPIRLRGVIDRVDANAAGELRVVDYKTGSRGLSPRDLVEGRRLQLPLYALAAEEALGLGRPVDGLYWQITQAQAGALQLSTFTHEGRAGLAVATALARQHVAETVTRVRAGRFAPAPPRGGCPIYCPARAFCWRYQPEGR